jgi:hypothetical protein
MVLQSLNMWLSGQITVRDVTVTPGPGGDYSQIVVAIQYVLIETQTSQLAQIIVT